MPNDLTDLEARRLQQRLERVATLLDDQFQLPGTRWRFGWDALIGLIPGGGDVLGAALSSWLVYEAWRLGVSRHLLARMGGNVILELLVGAVPVLGDIFDFFFKANRRNLRLLHRHIKDQAGPASREKAYVGARSPLSHRNASPDTQH